MVRRLETDYEAINVVDATAIPLVTFELEERRAADKVALEKALGQHRFVIYLRFTSFFYMLNSVLAFGYDEY